MKIVVFLSDFKIKFLGIETPLYLCISFGNPPDYHTIHFTFLHSIWRMIWWFMEHFPNSDKRMLKLLWAPLIKISKQNMYKWYRQGIFRLLVLLMFDVNFSYIYFPRLFCGWLATFAHFGSLRKHCSVNWWLCFGAFFNSASPFTQSSLWWHIKRCIFTEWMHLKLRFNEFNFYKIPLSVLVKYPTVEEQF